MTIGRRPLALRMLLIKSWDDSQMHLITSTLLVCSRERTAEILSDERVQAAQAAGRGGRVRSEEETSAAASVTVVGDNRAQVSAPGQNGAQPQVCTTTLHFTIYPFNTGQQGRYNNRAPSPRLDLASPTQIGDVAPFTCSVSLVATACIRRIRSSGAVSFEQTYTERHPGQRCCIPSGGNRPVTSVPTDITAPRAQILSAYLLFLDRSICLVCPSSAGCRKLSAGLCRFPLGTVV